MKAILKTNVRSGEQPLLSKGFTLIELLAVIVILSIIAVIAIPQILNIITDSKEKRAKISAENYVRAVEMAVMNKDTDIETKNLNGTYEIKDNGKKIVSENNTIDIEFDGQALKEGYLTITNYKVTAVDFDIDKYCIRLVDGEIKLFNSKEIEKSMLVIGEEFNSIIKSLVNEKNTSYTFVDKKVISIDFYSNGILPSGYTKERLELLPKASVSTNNDIFAYNDNGQIYVISDKLISFNEISKRMFSNFKILAKLQFRSIDTSKVTDMNAMFEYCNNLLKLDLTNFNTEKVVAMGSMFNGCSSLVELDVSNFDTSNVTTMSHMFYACSGLKTLDISNFITSKVTDMTSMFWNCSNIIHLDLSNFNTSKVTSMFDMFSNCSKLQTLDINNFNTSKVTNMHGMFYGCSNLTELDVSNFDTSNVTTMSHMFNGCKNVKSLNVSNFNTVEVTDMQSMFYRCSNLEFLDLSNFSTRKVKNMYHMFHSCINLKKIIIGGNFDTSEVTTMEGMFEVCKNLTELNLTSFSTDKVTTMQNMFNATSNLETLSIGCGWKTAEIYLNMFGGSKYTQEQFDALISNKQQECSLNTN